MPDLNRLFRPRSIAVIGASENEQRIGGRPLRILRQRGYPGDVYPVNPKYETVQGMPCYSGIDELPDGVDLYLICLPADVAVTMFEQAAEHGAGAAVIFAGGFAETGPQGQDLQQRLATVATEHDIALVGPNSLGFAALGPRTFGTFATMLETLPDLPPGEVALVSQSGGAGFNLLTEAHWAGARFCYVVATGNEAGLTFADYVEYLASDPAVSVIVGYLEGTVDGARLGRAFEAARRAGKPVFVLKSGSSERGRASVASHTAQISGNDDAFDALFDRYGVVRLESMDEAVDVARAVTLGAGADGVAIASNSGGAAAYLSDAAERYGIELSDFADHTREALSKVLPAFAGVRNPLDFTPQVINEPALLEDVLRILDEDDAIECLLLYLGGMEYLADALLPVVAAAGERMKTPLGFAWYGVSDRVRTDAANAGLQVAADPARLLRGLGLMRRGSEAIASAVGAPSVPAGTTEVRASTITPRPVEGGDRYAVDEAQLMDLLEGHGLRLPRRHLVASESEAVEAAEAIGYPCGLKLIDPLLAHRAVNGAVRLGLDDEGAVRDNYAGLARDHGARRGVVVEQVETSGSVELIVGVMADPVFGTRAVLGSGGIDVGDGADTRTLVPPYEAGATQHALETLRVAGRLREVRGSWEPLAESLTELLNVLAAHLSACEPPLSEIECNPVLVRGEDLVVLDALAFVDDETTTEAAS